MSEVVAIRDRARLAGPTSSHLTVERTRLDPCYEGSTGRILRVLAPAGYGKSTLVARWVANESRPVRWLDLEPIDNDPLVLGDALLRGLGDLAEQRDTAGRHLDVEHGVARRLADLVTASHPFVLVLDDIHHIDNERSTAFIDLLAERLPADSTFVLIGRAHHHGAAFARLRLSPGVVDVTTAELAFDLAETEKMLTHAGVPTDVDLAESFTRQFEGWPAGIRLGALIVHSRWQQGAPSPVDGLVGSAYVTEYVAAEWLGGLDDDDRILLTEAGCLGRFSAEMCRTVLGLADPARALRRLVREELLILPLDQHDGWYRMHPILSEFLSNELRDSDPERWHDIQLVAAQFWEDAGDIDLAIGYAAKGGDLDRCEELIFRHGGEYSANGMAATVERWLGLFDEQRLLASPNLCVIAAINLPQTADTGRARRLARLLRDVGEIDGEAADDDLTLIANVMRLALDPRPPDQATVVAEHAVAHLRPGAWRVLASWILGGELFLMGDRRAEAVLRDAIFEAKLLDLSTQYANTQATLAVILELDGRRDEAESLARRAHERIGVRHAEEIATSAIASAMVALVEGRAGRHDIAREAAERARRQLTDLWELAVWFNVLGRLALARAYLLLDDATTAHELIGEIDAQLAEFDERMAIRDHVDAVRAEVEAASAVLADRTWQLTDAELRVMQYLPTNLSLADIAARLFVSRNTVKSHAAAIYRKLGTTSRGDAVDIAREAGLLDDRPPET